MSGVPAGAGSLIGKRLGKYDMLALLALGGTAEIYLARVGGAGGFEKYVVVKCLHDHLADDQDFVKMFLDEARLAAVLDHSNIVQTFELGEYQNRYYMVMEFLAGLSLAMIVRRAGERLPGGFLPVPIIFNVAAQAAAGLHYAHERTANGKPLNMVHRDISPQNLVISFEGIVKVVDFGIARAELRETKTKAGTIKGKFAYMSPEQCVATNVDRRTDVFALGVIVHELLTGRRLFKRNSPYETYQAVIECAVDPPSQINNQVDPAIDAIVMQAVAKDKDQRYPTAEAFGDALLGYLHQRGKGSGGAELSRFFEQYFADEIEAHGERMRELISGREFSVDTSLGWDDEEEDKANQTVDLGAKLESGDLDRLRTGGDEEAVPADRTRIELNPLQTVEELDQQVARNAGRPVGVRAPLYTVTSGPEPLPAPPTGPRAVLGHDVPNQPTAVAQPAPELAPTALEKGKLVDPSVPAAGPASATHAAVRASELNLQPPPLHSGPLETGPQPLAPQYPLRSGPLETGPQPLAPQYPLRSGPLETGPQPLAPQPYGAQPPHGQYGQQPLVSQLASHGQQSPQYPMVTGPQPLVQPYPMVTGPQPLVQPYPMVTGPQPLVQPYPQYPVPTGPHPPVSYPVLPGGQRPFSSASDLAPSNPPGGQRYGNPLDPSAAANLMSPVGEHYPQRDWQQAAAAPAKAIPPWLLVALFAVALGGALLLTLVIAKLVS